MGKQNRRKKEESKKDRKKRLQERRERAIEEAQEAEDEYYDDTIIDVGDRVWYRNSENHHDAVRGVVKEEEDEFVFVELSDKEVLVRIAKAQVIKDPFDWTLRFKVGDEVVCYMDHWRPCKVTHLFPIFNTENDSGNCPFLPCYKCEVLDGGGCRYLKVPEDDDSYIRAHPQNFRFSVGQTVVVSSRLAVGLKKKQYDRFLTATVTRVDVLGLSDYYFAYEVKIVDESNRSQKCFVAEDTDEYIACVSSTPRKRLMDSIEQGCSYEHIDQLVSVSELDVYSFQDLVLMEAIKHASYGMLLWLEEHADLDFANHVDNDGNTLLFRICRESRIPERFFDEAGARVSQFDETGARVSQDVQKTYLKQMVAWEVETDRMAWLDQLVTTGNARALDLALSPRVGFAWQVSFFDIERLREVEEKTRLLGMTETVNIIDEYKRFFVLLKLYRGFSFITRTEGEEDFLAQLRSHEVQEEIPPASAHSLLRFISKWTSISMERLSIEGLLFQVVKHGWYKTFRWLVDADGSLLSRSDKLKLPVDGGDFQQAELYQKERSRIYTECDLVTAASVWECYPPYVERKEINLYMSYICRHGGIASAESLVSFLQSCKEEKYIYYGLKQLFEFRISLLQDGKGLQGRLRILDFLVKEKGLSPPLAVDAVQWRQCEILRWLVAEALVDLNKNATDDEAIKRRCSKLQVLGGRAIPGSMTVMVLLCLAAIEYDDLRSLEWLMVNHDAALEDIRANSWNAVHLCAVFGRLEILFFLRSFDFEKWSSLLQEPCGRKSWQRGCLYAAHLAAEHGHVFVADRLLSSGCPYMDWDGKPIDLYARNSPFEHVRKWGKLKEKPMRLRKQVDKLLTILSKKSVSLQDVKRHVTQSKCLDVDEWRDAEIDDADTRGQVGLSYSEVFLKCLSDVGSDFAVWIYRHVVGKDSNDYMWNIFWKCDPRASEPHEHALSRESLLMLLERMGETDLVTYLRQGWVTDIKCLDPTEADPALKELATTVKSDSMESIRARLLVIHVVEAVLKAAWQEFTRLLEQGATVPVIVKMRETVLAIMKRMAQEEDKEIDSYMEDYRSRIRSDGTLKLESFVVEIDYKSHPLSRHVLFYEKAYIEWNKLYVLFAAEGYTELVAWTLLDGNGNWDSTMELKAIRVAAYMGNSETVLCFLEEHRDVKLHSKRSDRVGAAILGALENGRLEDVESYLDFLPGRRLPADPLATRQLNALMDLDREEVDDILTGSMSSVLTFHALVEDVDLSPQTERSLTDDKPIEASFKWLIANSECEAATFLRAANVLARFLYYNVERFQRLLLLFDFLLEELLLDVWECQADIVSISQDIIKNVRDDTYGDAVGKWLKHISGLGIDMQSINWKKDVFNDRQKKVNEYLLHLQQEQGSVRRPFDLIKEGSESEMIFGAVEASAFGMRARDKNGFLLTHVAAAYNRAEILRWLVEEKGMSLSDQDTKGRSVLQVAKDSHSTEATKWIEVYRARAVISAFMGTHFRRRLATQRRRRRTSAAKTAQALFRGWGVRQRYRGLLLWRLEESSRFDQVWHQVMKLMPSGPGQTLESSWSSKKIASFDMQNRENQLEAEEFQATSQKLIDATTRALEEEEVVSDRMAVPEDEKAIPNEAASSDSRTGAADVPPAATAYDRIMMTNDVVKWVKRGDNKYVDFFIRRVTQLASGERSRILAKRLRGCKSLIYEMYLEQKSGHRILWTLMEDGSLLLWYVAKHDQVSRFAHLIDEAERRSSRRQTSADVLQDDTTGSPRSAAEHMLLDPLGNAPLKLYELRNDEVENLRDVCWKPRLFLTDEEREVVETKGTVLLLGRSGTGKTLCICNRMDYDKQKAGDDEHFSQLFVARSPRLCKYVSETVGGLSSDCFTTFRDLLRSLETALPVGEDGCIFMPSQRMDFVRFRREVYRDEASSSGLDALLVWTNIRSFLKGSIEALMSPNSTLSKADYLSSDKVGKKRCRLSVEQREQVYDAFEKYNRYITDKGLWDDCDRISSLLKRLQVALASSILDTYTSVKRSKVYVDEIQDYTQAETLLFFYLAGPGNLFLAGDPAQNVVEGVEFRFEEVRSVGYYISGLGRRDLIPSKPKTVNVNFRSHSGVLNVAAAVLDVMFNVYPGSAKQLRKDRGLFRGPRPGIFYKVAPSLLKNALAEKLNGAVILTHDSNVDACKRALGGYQLVYGIRQAKGLEYQSVILLDFFRGLPSRLQKPWRDMLLHRDTSKYPEQYPEIEGHLKLLYTAVTRCIEQLFVAETAPSIAGEAFIRLLMSKTTPGIKDSQESARAEALAERCDIHSIENMGLTPDQWRLAGFDNAINAEAAVDPREAEGWLEKALFCFNQVNDVELASTARCHLSSVRLREELEMIPPNDSGRQKADPELELRASQMMEHLLSESLLEEAHILGETVLPFMSEYSQEQLQSRLLHRLADITDGF